MEVLQVASTPSPPADIHTPPTPKHGYSDNWEPFSPRKSARLSSQRAVNRTPSPKVSARHHLASHSRSPRSSKKHHSEVTLTTPATSPQKKRFPTMDSVRRASGPLTAESTRDAAAALGLTSKATNRSGTTNFSNKTGMLPTPAKTPARKHPQQNEASISAIARNLFPAEDEVLPSPKKKRAKKYTGISMDSFMAEEPEIQIFTDSHERIPEVDRSSDNPFYGPPVLPAPEPTKRRSKRRSVAVPGEGAQTVDEAMQREDGLVYCFRGKKMFRRFADKGSDEELIDEDNLTETVVADQKPLTRSSIKPRLLFPPLEQAKDESISFEDEEAETDIEDHISSQLADEKFETPSEAVGDLPGTPDAPKFAPASPPDSRRTTRSGNKVGEEATPIKPRGGKRSPFDSWRRVKNGADSHGHKRPGSPLGNQAATKRTRA